MKLGENDYLMRQLFSPSFMRIGQKLWNFYYWPIFERVRFFLTQTLHTYMGHFFRMDKALFIKQIATFQYILTDSMSTATTLPSI